MAWLNYRHLIYFKVIAEEGGISKASKKLFVGQPALSAQLKQLEDSFGYQLFERSNRKLILTDAGKLALKYAVRINDLGLELVDSMRDQSFSPRPEIQIGAMDSVPKQLLQKLVEFAQKNMDCKISISEGSGEELLRELDAHRVDLIIANHPGGIPTNNPGIFSKSIGTSSVSIYGAAKYKRLTKKFPKSLQGQNIILPTKDSKLRSDFDHFLQSNDISMKVCAEIQDTSLQKYLASSGTGMTPLPDISMKSGNFDKKLSKIAQINNLTEEYWMISMNRWIENPIASYLIKNFHLTKIYSKEE